MAEPEQHRAEQLASTLPPLLVAADRVAATVAQGVHGRRRVGQGETFWQFRQYQPGDAPQRIDWRESAKSQRLFVRETEWEAAQSVWLWRDTSASMDYGSSARRCSTARPWLGALPDPRSATRSPPRTRSAASARVSRSARSSFAGSASAER